MQGHRWLWLMLLWAPLALGDGIYKWKDANGEIHYGEAPPEEGAAAQVTVKTDPVSGTTPPPANHNEATQRLLNNFQEERAKKDAAAAKAAEEKEKRQQECVVARDTLLRYQEAGGLYTLDKNGERHVLDDAQHAAVLKRAKAEVEKYCK